MKKFWSKCKTVGKYALGGFLNVAFGLLDTFFEALDGAADMCSLV